MPTSLKTGKWLGGGTGRISFPSLERSGKIQIQSPASLALALPLTGTAAAPLTGEEGSALFLKRNALQKHVSKKTFLRVLFLMRKIIK